VLVNRYINSDKLGVHVEDTMAFGDVIVGVSLGDTDYLKLADVDNR
jgi:alkylated DNA repair dioxygenase AlkB